MAVVPTVLDFGAEQCPGVGGGGAAMSKGEKAREVLKQVENIDLNLARAGKAFVPGGKVERDLVQAKEDFSKVKFTYQELTSKNDFIRSVVEGLDNVEQDPTLEEKLAEGKLTLKKTKEKCKALRDEVEGQLENACNKYQQLQTETEEFRALLESGDFADQEQASTRLAELEEQIAKQKEVIARQEESIRDLSQEKQELSMAVRGLDSEVSELTERAHPSVDDLQDRRAAAWFQNANAVMSSLGGVTNVTVKESEVVVEFEVLPFARGNSRQAPAAGKAYVLALEFGKQDEHLTGATLEPQDVDIADLISTCISESGKTEGVATLLMETKSRLSCRLALTNELEALKSRFSFTMTEDSGAVILGFSPAVGKNASRWRCEVTVDADYPREHVVPELESLRNGAFQSPGMKRERALMDSVSRAGHTTVTEMLEDVARRLSN